MATAQQPLDRTDARCLFVVAGLAAVYFMAFNLWYGGTSLGLNPVLDGRETILLAQDIASGNLPAEPFYRAPLYAALLTPFAALDFDYVSIALAARMLNGLCHITSTILIYLIARRLWQSRPAAVVSSALWGLYPVALHFAGDPLDITFGITMMLAALWLALKVWNNPEPPGARTLWFAAAVGLCIGIGYAARPHLLTLGLGWPLLLIARAAFLLTGEQKPDALRWLATAGASFGGLAVILLLFGIANYSVSGEFRTTPTQGGFNLYAANTDHANGRYFKQAIYLKDLDRHINPAQYEAREYYKKKMGEKAPDDPSTISAYWRGEAIKDILENPLEFIELLGKKQYYLLHDYEQYNNKTYAVLKARAPALRYNPLGWTVLLSLALIGGILAWSKPGVQLIGAWFFIFAAGVLIFYVSARFRLPLAALLAILAGGSLHIRYALRDSRRELAIALTCAAAAIALAFTDLHDVNDPVTQNQDYLLMAQAAYDLGRDEEALEMAEKAKDSNAAEEIRYLSKFNILQERIADGIDLKAEDIGSVLEDIYIDPFVLSIKPFAISPVRYVEGTLKWKLGHRNSAKKLILATAKVENPAQDNALAALLLIGEAKMENLTKAKLAELPTIIVLAHAALGNSDALAEAYARMPAEQVERELHVLRVLYLDPPLELPDAPEPAQQKPNE